MEENYQVKNSTTLSRISFFTLGIFIIFLSYLIISITLDNALVYPTLTSIFASIGDLLSDNDFYINLITTLFRTIIVILISLLISLIMSFIYILYKPFFEVFRPLCILSELLVAPTAIMFGGVPTIVMVPPVFAATAKPISKGEHGILAATQIPISTGIKQATVPVFEAKDDMRIVSSIMAIMRGSSLVPTLRTTEFPIVCANPESNMAAPTTNIPANNTTVELDKPEKTSDGDNTPKKPKATLAPMAVTAKGISSVTNKNATTPKTTKVIMA